MRNNIKIKRLAYKASSFITPMMAGAATILGLINEIEPKSSSYDDWPTFLLQLCVIIQTHSLPLFITIGCIALLSIVVNKFGDPWIWDKLQFLLNEYQAKAFASKVSEPNHHHRVTLFKYRQWCFFRRHCTGKWYWPWGKHNPFSGWLIPVLRSGYTSQKTKIIFSAPDNADEAEGVAGKAWSTQSAVIFKGLPPLSKKGPKRDIKNYCGATACPEEIVNQKINLGKPMPRSIAATPIEVNGKIWGVVVLDSRAPDGISDESILNYELTVALIGQLLEKTI